MGREALAKEVLNILGIDCKDQIHIALGIQTSKEKILFEKLANAWTLEECHEVYKMAPPKSKVKKWALEKIDKFLSHRLAIANTLDECRKLYDLAPPESEVKRQALENMLVLARTIEEYKMVFYKTTKHSPEAYMCIQKIGELLEKEARLKTARE